MYYKLTIWWISLIWHWKKFIQPLIEENVFWWKKNPQQETIIFHKMTCATIIGTPGNSYEEITTEAFFPFLFYLIRVFKALAGIYIAPYNWYFSFTYSCRLAAMEDAK